MNAYEPMTSFVLRLLIREVLPCSTWRLLANRGRMHVQTQFWPWGHWVRNVRRELSELVSDHVFRYGDVLVVLPIVDLELQTHEVGQYGCRPCLGLDWGQPLAGLRSLYR